MAGESSKKHLERIVESVRKEIDSRLARKRLARPRSRDISVRSVHLVQLRFALVAIVSFVDRSARRPKVALLRSFAFGNCNRVRAWWDLSTRLAVVCPLGTRYNLTLRVSSSCKNKIFKEQLIYLRSRSVSRSSERLIDDRSSIKSQREFDTFEKSARASLLFPLSLSLSLAFSLFFFFSFSFFFI